MSELRQAQGVVNLVAHFLTIFQLRHPASIYGHFHLVDLQQGWGRLTTLLFLLSHFFLANELRYKDLGGEWCFRRKRKGCLEGTAGGRNWWRKLLALFEGKWFWWCCLLNLKESVIKMWSVVAAELVSFFLRDGSWVLSICWQNCCVTKSKTFTLFWTIFVKTIKRLINRKQNKQWPNDLFL